MQIHLIPSCSFVSRHIARVAVHNSKHALNFVNETYSFAIN